MRVFGSAVLAWVFVSLIAVGASGLELPELAEKTKASVVHLEVLDGAGEVKGSGTGFYISADRVVTNDHVVQNAAAMRAKLTDGRAVDVIGVLATDPERDLAILQLPADANAPPPLSLGDSEKLRQGDEVVVIGSPRGLAGTLSVGIVSALRGEGLEGEADDGHPTQAWGIQITAAISPGSSGSPIMTRDGQVVAVAVGILAGGANIGFGIPINEAKGMLERIGPDATPQAFAAEDDGNVTRNLIISGVFFGLLGLAYAISRIRDRA